jgi:asparagine synthase (glutamine-hydrolysing)
MCGIAGIVDFQTAPDEASLSAMERALVHRGPDEGRIWKTAHCGLAHRRLRIIDLSSAAAQPMTNEDGRVCVVFNGEIYNFHSLRDELLQLGHKFRSRSDTEVLVHGYESWGTGICARLRGMFAFAIWDASAQQLVVARDRLGKKPLFYNIAGARFAFGSELSVFKAVALRPLTISVASFREYMEYGYVQSPSTILEEVYRLPAGHWAVWNRSGLQTGAYWSLPVEPSRDRNADGAERAAEALESSLRDAVVSRLESDVPLGCFLSGGVDSSLVAALAQESIGAPLKTYTVGFDDCSTSEATHARRVAQRLGTDHHELTISSSAVLEEFEQILSSAAEPLGDDSYVPTFLISRATRRHVTVAISGDGGDELFAGYTKYAQFLRARSLHRLPLPWRGLAAMARSDRWFKAFNALAQHDPLELARWLSTLWKREDLSTLLAQSPSGQSDEDLFTRSWRRRSRFPETERWMLTDMETYLEGDILTKVDRAAMAIGLEVRSPFLDAQFVEHALGWPVRARVKGGGKEILKTMLAKRLPVEWFSRPKQGFGMPIEQWFRGALQKMLLHYTDSGRMKRRGLLRPAAVSEAVKEHLSGQRNFARKLYAIIAFEIWCERFFDEN